MLETALLGAVVVLTRLPFLAAGYGTDRDGWSLAGAAREIAATGHYKASRLPGFPLQEYASALVWRGGPWALNGLSACFTAIAVVILFRILRRLGGGDAGLLALAFAFVPTVYISSTAAMDYLFAVAFLLGAVELALAGRAATAGLMLGMAIGARITTAVFLLPLALIVAGPGPGRLRRLAALAAWAAIVGAAWYAPVFQRYGAGFLSYYEPQGETRSIGDFIGGIIHPGGLPFPAALVFGQATVGVFGLLGAAAVAVLVWVAATRGLRARLGREVERARLLALPGRLALAAGLAVLLTVILYVRLPHDEGYLIPALPFLLMLLAAAVPRGLLRAGAVALLVSPFVLGVDAIPPKKGVTPASRSPFSFEFGLSRETLRVDPLRGPVLLDYEKRRRMLDLARTSLRALDRIPAGGILVAGMVSPVLYYDAPDDAAHLRYVDLLRRGELDQIIRRGDPVFYLPDVRERTLRFEGFDLAAAGARELTPEPGDPGAPAAGPPR